MCLGLSLLRGELLLDGDPQGVTQNAVTQSLRLKHSVYMRRNASQPAVWSILSLLEQDHRGTSGPNKNCS
jgi:hypothetical protein